MNSDPASIVSEFVEKFRNGLPQIWLQRIGTGGLFCAIQTTSAASPVKIGMNLLDSVQSLKWQLLNCLKMILNKYSEKQ